MSFWYTRASQDIGRGLIDFREAGADIRAIIVMTNTTADTERDVATISAFTTLDEMDGAAYVRKALANQVWNEDQPNDRSEFDADDVTWTALGAGTRSMAGIIIYRHVTDDTDSVPICYIDTGGFPLAATGTDFIAQWNAEGIAQAVA